MTYILCLLAIHRWGEEESIGQQPVVFCERCGVGKTLWTHGP